MIDTRPTVLLAAYRGRSITADILQLFKQANCIIDVHNTRRSLLSKSRAVRAWHTVSVRRQKDYGEALLSHILRSSYDWIVILDDHTLRIMNELIQDDKIARNILPLSKLENRSVLGSKVALAHLSTTYGLSAPPSVIHILGEDIMAGVAHVSFPLLLKVDESNGGQWMSRCDNESELRIKLRELPMEQRKGRGVVLQRYIQGESIAGEALYKQGSLCAYATSKVEQTIGGEFSASCVRRYSPHPQAVEAMRRAGESLGINGFCSFTFMRDVKADVYYLVEADMRPHAWFTLARFAGVDFSSAIRDYLSHSNTAVISPTMPDTSAEVRYFERDVYRMMQGRDLAGLAQWIFNTEGRWRFIPLYDVRSFIFALEELLYPYVYRFVSAHPAVGVTKRNVKHAFSVFRQSKQPKVRQ